MTPFDDRASLAMRCARLARAAPATSQLWINRHGRHEGCLPPGDNPGETPSDARDPARVGRRSVRFQGGAACRRGRGRCTGLGRAGRGEADAGSRRTRGVVGPGDLFVALNTGVNTSPTPLLVVQARSSRPIRRPPWLRSPPSSGRRAPPASSLSWARPARPRRRTSSARCAAPQPDHLGGGEPEQRDRPPADGLQARARDGVLVTEMGMRGLGQIAALCAVARPDVARRHLDRPRAPRAPRLGRARCRGERRGDRGSPGGRDRRRAGRCAGARALPRPRRHRDPPVRSHRGDGSGNAWRFPSAGGEISLTLRSPRVTWRRTPWRLWSPTPRSGCRSSGRRGRRPRSRCPAGVARSRRSPAAASSSTTPTTRTRSRCGPRSSTSSSVPTGGAGSRSSARWPSSATESPRYHDEIGELAATSSGSSSSSRSASGRARTSAARRRPGRHWIAGRRTRSTRRRPARTPGDAILVKASRAVGLEGIPASIEKRSRAWSES